MGTCQRIGCGAPIVETGKRRGRPRRYCSKECASLALRKRKTSLQQSYRRNLETALAGPECCRDARHPRVARTEPKEPNPPGFSSPVHPDKWATYAEAYDNRDPGYPEWGPKHQGTATPCGPKRRRCDQHNQFRSFERDNLNARMPEPHAVNETEDQKFVLSDFLYDRNGETLIGVRVARNPDAWLSQDASDKRQDAELAKLEQQQYELVA